MTKAELLALISTNLTVVNPGDVTAAKIKAVLDAVAGVMFDEIKNLLHVEASSGSLTGDVATDIYFATPFTDTTYAMTYLAVDSSGAKVDCAIVKHADRLVVTAAESDCTFDFVASVSTIDMNPT